MSKHEAKTQIVRAVGVSANAQNGEQARAMEAAMVKALEAHHAEHGVDGDPKKANDVLMQAREDFKTSLKG
jgi:hypothetical protein